MTRFIDSSFWSVPAKQRQTFIHAAQHSVLARRSPQQSCDVRYAVKPAVLGLDALLKSLLDDRHA
jgi:hypothetical protein